MQFVAPILLKPYDSVGRDQLPRYMTLLTVVLALISVMLFFILRDLIDFVYCRKTGSILPGSIAALIGAALFARNGYENLPGVFTALAKTTAAGILAELVFDPPDFTLANDAYWHLAAYVDWGYWVAVPVAFLSIWRPSFLYPAALYVISTRYAVNKISGFTLSTLDLQYMVEMAQFLGLSACGIVLFRKYTESGRARSGFHILGRVDVHELALCLSFIAIGFHLGNYFWSGVAKLYLGPKPWSWALENQTQNMMIGALKRGVLPSGAFPWVTQGLFDSFGAIAPLSNVLVLTTQLFAVIAVLRVTWLRIASLAYDALHIGIFLLGGLFFWQWIWNNLSIMVAVHRRSDQEIGWAPKVSCMITILLGFSASLGASARLAWWDVVDIKIPMIQAQAENGMWIDVPVSYFLSHSYAISHGYVDLAMTQGHYSPTFWGSAETYDRQRTSGTCPEPPYLEVTESQSERAERLERVGSFIRAHHRKLLRRVDENGRYNFYLRAHHHPSNPWMYPSFSNLDLRKIRRYRLLTQSICLSMSDGRLIQRIIKEDATTFNVDE